MFESTLIPHAKQIQHPSTLPENIFCIFKGQHSITVIDMTYSTNTAPTNSYCNLTSTSLQRPDLLNQITTVKLSKKKLNFAQSQCDCLNFNSISDSDTFEIQPVQALLAQTTQMRAVTLSRIINVSTGTTRTSIQQKSQSSLLTVCFPRG